MLHALYGDGIHDDTLAIQEMLDASCEVRLPAPKVHYLISKPLELPSGCKLVLPRFAEIRLAPDSNCVMLRNKMVEDYAERTDAKIFSYLNFFSPNAPVENIEVEGGIWNFNNKNQIPNGCFDLPGYTGNGMHFYNVKNFRMSSMTLKDPCNFCVTLDRVSYFHISDITFDFNEGNPYQCNMDGIHMCGGCHHGLVEKLYGTCYDDIVAMNADEGSGAPITDIVVRDIFTEGSYSAVRMLTASPECYIRNIHISDIRGTFYHFGISLQHYYNTGKRGRLENIVIDNVFAARSDRSVVKFPMVNNYRKYGIIDIEGRNDIKNLSVTNVHRSEYVDAVPTVKIFEDAVIDNLVLDNITAENHTESAEMQLIDCQGTIRGLQAENLWLDGAKVAFCV